MTVALNDNLSTKVILYLSKGQRTLVLMYLYSLSKFKYKILFPLPVYNKERCTSVVYNCSSTTIAVHDVIFYKKLSK